MCVANVEVSLDSGVWIWMCCRVRLSLSTEVFESVAGATAHVCVSSDIASFLELWKRLLCCENLPLSYLRLIPLKFWCKEP